MQSLEKYHELLAKAKGEDDRHCHRERDRPRHNRDTYRDTHPRGERDDGKARDSQSSRYRDRDYDRDRERDYRHRDRPVARSRSPDRDGDRPRDRHRDTRGGESKPLSGRTFMRPGESDDRTNRNLKSLEGMRGMFKKPGEETSDRNVSRRDRFQNDSRRREDGSTPAWKKKTFMRPNEDGEMTSKTSSASSSSAASSSRTPSWKKQSSLKPSDSEKTSPAVVDAPSKRPQSSSDESSSSSESDSSSDTEDERSPSPPPRSLSEAEMNQLGAKIVRAELMGNEVRLLIVFVVWKSSLGCQSEAT